MSFLTLGIFWAGQQTQLNNFSRADRNVAWIHIAFLLAVSITPFSTVALIALLQLNYALGLRWPRFLEH